MPILIDSDFPGGGVEAVRFPDSATVEFEAPLDSGKQSLWFCFRVRGARGRRLRFRQKGLENVLGIRESRGYAPVCPVYRNAGSDWARIDPAKTTFIDDPLDFSFSHDFTDDETYFAFCFPYTFDDLSAYLERADASRIRIEFLGKSDGGRDFPCLTVGYPERVGVENLVVVIARQHAGEVTGSFALEGLMDALCADTAASRELLESTLFLVFPFADIDCVETGRYGKGQYPVDYNRDWSLAPWHKGTALMQEAIARFSSRYRLKCAIDLHAPQPGAPSYFVPNAENPIDGEAWRLFWNLAHAFEDACRGRLDFRLADVDTNVLNWGSVYNKTMNSSYFYHRYGAVAFTAEISYHRDGKGKLLSRDDWRSFGGLLADAYAGSALNKGGALPSADRGRIPPWVIPGRPGGWEHITLPRSMEVKTEGDGLALDPLGPNNQAWLTCPLRFRPDSDEVFLRLESDRDFGAALHRTYYRDGCALGIGKTEYRRFEAGEHGLSYTGMELPGDSYSISLKLCALESRLRLSPGGPDAS